MQFGRVLPVVVVASRRRMFACETSLTWQLDLAAQMLWSVMCLCCQWVACPSAPVMLSFLIHCSRLDSNEEEWMSCCFNPWHQSWPPSALLRWIGVVLCSPFSNKEGLVKEVIDICTQSVVSAIAQCTPI